MKIAVLTRRKDPFSFTIYRENIVEELSAFGIEMIPFGKTGPIPKGCDFIWDPGMAGRRAPHTIFKSIRKPLVITVHGAVASSMKWREVYKNPLNALIGQLLKKRALARWRWFREKISAVITVSEYGAQEVSHALNIPESNIYSIYHGVDHDIFHIYGERSNAERPYLLHVSQYQPKKNVNRIFVAYSLLPKSCDCDLIAILPNYRGKINSKGIKIIYEGFPSAELAKWYRGALGFVFPSLHETFGMPILEAMACGCPVITSNVTACPEVAGDAALLVNPRLVEDIANAMKRLIEDESLRQTLCQKGLVRAQQFTWRKSAEKHLKVFEGVISGKY
jgi:glycosyltransferase involved in cell wall biosynthesis